MTLHPLTQLTLQQPPSTPEGPKWTEKLAVLIALATLVLGAVTSWKDIGPVAPQLVSFGSALSLLLFGQPLLTKCRAIVRARKHARNEAARLSRFSKITSDALALVTSQLSPWRGDANTASHTIEQLVNLLDGKATQEAHLLRDVVTAYCMPFNVMPKSVTPPQSELAARILNEALHRLLEKLPRYLRECETVTEQHDDSRAPYIFSQTNILRHRVNDLIREYNRLAKLGHEEGFSVLNPIDHAKFLLEPPRARTAAK
ncbi:hypothetical protein [Myxococcus sp. Y35]|uniref:hypothetical protein n=1 Tax=Pseudomyxococcus flavus TaxID=3115648 RepID=UPI003CF6D1FE